MLKVGKIAPGFSLFEMPEHKISLSDYEGKRVILVFYPADWSPVCGDEVTLYNEMLSFFEKHDAKVIGISVDSKWCHQAFSHDRNLHFPLLSDFEPKGEVAKMYNVYDESEGTAQRALFVIDEFGIIRWNYLSPVDTNPGADGILTALEEIDNSRCILPQTSNSITIK
jgi:peroxiredoxin